MAANRSVLARTLLTPRGGIAAGFLAVTVACALLSPWIAPYAYDLQNLGQANREPSALHWRDREELHERRLCVLLLELDHRGQDAEQRETRVLLRGDVRDHAQ